MGTQQENARLEQDLKEKSNLMRNHNQRLIIWSYKHERRHFETLESRRVQTAESSADNLLGTRPNKYLP